MDDNKNPEILETKVLLDRSGIIIETDQRGQVAYFSYSPSNAMPKLTATVVKATLKKANVVFGLIAEEISNLDGVEDPVRNRVVARGRKAQVASEPKVVYRFPTNPYEQLKRAGRREQMNYRERGQLPFVKRGEVVAEITTDGETKPGMTVTGEEYMTDVYEAVNVEPGKNVSIMGGKLIAQIDGAPRLNKSGQVEVYKEWVVDGDVEIRTGNIVFPGPVIIKGDIQPGFYVKAKSINVRGIENKVTIECEEDLIIHGGVQGGKITCGGNLSAKFINNASVVCHGDAEIKVSIINSDIASAGSVTTQTIFGGSITALSGVTCVNLSSEANRSTVIIGVDPINQENISNIIREKIEIEGQIHHLMEKTGDNLKFYERYKRIAEEIKVYLPERDSLVQRLQALDDDEDADQSSREFFEGRLEELSEIVDPVEAELNEGKSRFATVKKEFMNEIMQLDKLKKRQADLEKQQQALQIDVKDVGVLVPKLTVKGKALMGTKISSTHARVVLNRDYNRVVFFQRKVHDSERKKYGSRKFIMAIDRM